MSSTDDTLTRLIAEADPLPATADATTVDRAWMAVQNELLDDPVVTPLRRPGRWRQAVVLSTVAVVAVGASAGAVYIATRTGVQNPPEWISAGGPGEMYRLDGTDFAAELATLAADIPYPDESSRQANLDAIVAEYADLTEPAEASTGALRAEIARGAICYWTMAWQDAGNDEGRASATAGLRGALTWPAVTDVDPQPAIDGFDADGFMAPTVFGHLPGIIDAAASGDAVRLTRAVDESAYCATATWERDDRAAEVPQAPTAEVPGSDDAEPAPTTRP